MRQRLAAHRGEAAVASPHKDAFFHRRKSWWMVCAGMIISTALLGILFTQIDLTPLRNEWRDYRPEFVVSALFMYVFSQLFRALRFRPLVGGKNIRILDLLPLLCIQALIQKLTPFMGGEISFLYFLRSRMGIGYSEAGFVLVLARGIDLFIAGIFLTGMAFLPLWSERSSIRMAAYASGVAGVFLIALSIVAILKTEKLSGIFHGSRSRVIQYLSGIFSRSSAWSGNMQDSWRSAGFWKSLGSCAFWSVLMWVALFLTFFLLFSSASPGVPWSLVLWGFFATWLLSALPVRGIADIGVWESGWTAILAGAGMPAPEALKVVLMTHAGLIAITILAGGIPLLVGFARRLPVIRWPGFPKIGDQTEKS